MFFKDSSEMTALDKTSGKICLSEAQKFCRIDFVSLKLFVRSRKGSTMDKMLMCQLEGLRKKMNELAEKEGLLHPDVLKLSQQIDVLHNRINKYYLLSSETQPEAVIKLNRNMKIKESKKAIHAYTLAASVG
ncbi:hypothetical protein GCM10008968_09470 [Bacillus horti]